MNSRQYNLNIYQFIRENGNWDNWDMVKIEDYPCLTELDAGKRERELIETLNATLNCNIPSRTYNEWVKNNKNKIKDRHQKYYKNNKDEIDQNYKKWYQNNKDKLKEKFNCSCGGCYTLENKTKHFKTKKHQLYLDQQ